MPDTFTDRSMLDLMKRFEQLAEDFARRDKPEVAQAIQKFITAKSYLDEVLVEASMSAVWESLAALVSDFIKKELEKASETKGGIREGWTTFVEGRAIPGQNFETLRRLIRSMIDDCIATMTGLRDNLVKGIEAQGIEIENAQQLEYGIEEMYSFRQGLAEFLRPRKRTLSVNQEAVGKARAAVGQRERWRGKEAS